MILLIPSSFHESSGIREHAVRIIVSTSRKASLLAAEVTGEVPSWSGAPHEEAFPWVDPAGFVLVVLRCTHKHST